MPRTQGAALGWHSPPFQGSGRDDAAFPWVWDPVQGECCNGLFAGGGKRQRREVVAAKPEARAAAEIARRDGPDDADLNYREGLRHLADGDAAAALDYFHLALHYAPDLFPACAALVRALLALGRSSEQAGAYREFLRANPGHPGAAYALAVCHHARGEYELALELLRPLAGRQPPHRDACNLLGLILGREFGQFEEAERLLRLALEPDPLWPVALSNLGWILLEKGNHAQGLKLLDAVLERDPDDCETRLVRSYMNLKRGEFEPGWRDYEARHHSRFALNRPCHFAQWGGTPISGKTLFISAEQGFGAVDSQLLGFIDKLTTTVITFAGITFSIFIG